MKRTVTALGLASALLLAGCAAEPKAPSSPTAEVPAADNTENGKVPDVPPEAHTPAPVAEDWFTVAYTDSYKSVFLLSKAQIAAATGLDPAAVTTDELAKAFASTDLWSSDERTAPYADVIVTAFATDAGSLKGAVNAALNSEHGRLKVFVLHDGHKTIAHVEAGGADDQVD